MSDLKPNLRKDDLDEKEKAEKKEEKIVQDNKNKKSSDSVNTG